MNVAYSLVSSQRELIILYILSPLKIKNDKQDKFGISKRSVMVEFVFQWMVVIINYIVKFHSYAYSIILSGFWTIYVFCKLIHQVWLDTVLAFVLHVKSQCLIYRLLQFGDNMRHAKRH